MTPLHDLLTSLPRTVAELQDWTGRTRAMVHHHLRTAHDLGLATQAGGRGGRWELTPLGAAWLAEGGEEEVGRRQRGRDLQAWVLAAVDASGLDGVAGPVEVVLWLTRYLGRCGATRHGVGQALRQLEAEGQVVRGGRGWLCAEVIEREGKQRAADVRHEIASGLSMYDDRPITDIDLAEFSL